MAVWLVIHQAAAGFQPDFENGPAFSASNVTVLLNDADPQFTAWTGQCSSTRDCAEWVVVKIFGVSELDTQGAPVKGRDALMLTGGGEWIIGEGYVAGLQAAVYTVNMSALPLVCGAVTEQGVVAQQAIAKNPTIEFEVILAGVVTNYTDREAPADSPPVELLSGNIKFSVKVSDW